MQPKVYVNRYTQYQEYRGMENRMFLFSSWKVHIIDMIMKACMKALEQKKPSLVLKRELDGGVKRVDLKGWVGSKGTRVVVPSCVQGPHQPAKSPSSKQLQPTATCFSRTVLPPHTSRSNFSPLCSCLFHSISPLH